MRRILPIGLAIYFLCYAVLAVLLRGAAPGPAAQTVQGVRRGSWDGAAGTAYFSGKRLDYAAFGIEKEPSARPGVIA